MVSVFIRHAYQEAWPPLPDRILAATLAGVMIAIKPPLFALPGIVVAAYYWWRTRTLSFLVPSGLLAAGVIGIAATAASLIAFPDYLDGIGTLMSDVYVPVRAEPLRLIADRGCLGVLSCLMLVILLSAKRKPPAAVILTLMASMGFFGAYVIQGKPFYYLIFPTAFFSSIAAWIMVYGRLCTLIGGSIATLAGATAVYTMSMLLVCVLFVVGFNDRRPVMSDLSWAAGLHHPRALAVSSDLATSFPLARQIGAVWVDRIHSQWVARYTRVALQSKILTESDRQKYLRYHERDLEWILRQISEQNPDIIFQDVRPGYSWLSLELSALEPGFLDKYDVIAEEGGIRVLRRRSETSR
jgi:hypothetical protein